MNFNTDYKASCRRYEWYAEKYFIYLVSSCNLKYILIFSDKWAMKDRMQIIVFVIISLLYKIHEESEVISKLMRNIFY